MQWGLKHRRGWYVELPWWPSLRRHDDIRCHDNNGQQTSLDWWRHNHLFVLTGVSWWFFVSSMQNRKIGSGGNGTSILTIEGTWLNSRGNRAALSSVLSPTQCIAETASLPALAHATWLVKYPPRTDGQIIGRWWQMLYTFFPMSRWCFCLVHVSGGERCKSCFQP